MANGVGAEYLRIYYSELDLRWPFKLSEYCSIFQAEAFEIKKATEITNNAENNKKKINIYV